MVLPAANGIGERRRRLSDHAEPLPHDHLALRLHGGQRRDGTEASIRARRSVDAQGREAERPWRVAARHEHGYRHLTSVRQSHPILGASQVRPCAMVSV